MDTQQISQLVARAKIFRDRNCGNTEIYRAFSGRSDGLDGLIIDVLGQIVWVRVFFACEQAFLNKLHSICQDIFTGQFVFLSSRKAANSWILPPSAMQPDQKYLAKEQERIFEIRNSYLYDFGIYPDARAARDWVAQNSQNRNVLNLFAYTCAFGIAAACGGAQEVCNIDVSKEFLSWGQSNASLNSINMAVVPEDCLKYLRRLEKRIALGQKPRPDLIIIDPPAFLAGRGSSRVTRNLWPQYLQHAAAMVQPNQGSLLLSCNDSYMLKKNTFTQMLRAEFSKTGSAPTLCEIKQTPDILGQEPAADSHYFVPQFWHAQFGSISSPEA